MSIHADSTSPVEEKPPTDQTDPNMEQPGGGSEDMDQIKSLENMRFPFSDLMGPLRIGLDSTGGETQAQLLVAQKLVEIAKTLAVEAGWFDNLKEKARDTFLGKPEDIAEDKENREHFIKPDDKDSIKKVVGLINDLAKLTNDLNASYSTFSTNKAAVTSAISRMAKVVSSGNFDFKNGNPDDLKNALANLSTISQNFEGSSRDLTQAKDQVISVMQGVVKGINDKKVAFFPQDIQSLEYIKKVMTSVIDFINNANEWSFKGDNSAYKTLKNIKDDMSRWQKPAPDASKIPTITTQKPQNTPPGNTTVPPGNTTVPPGNTTVPPENTTTPPGNTTVPPGNTTVPPTNPAPTVPPGNQTSPPTVQPGVPTTPPKTKTVPPTKSPTVPPTTPDPNATLPPLPPPDPKTFINPPGPSSKLPGFEDTRNSQTGVKPPVKPSRKKSKQRQH